MTEEIKLFGDDAGKGHVFACGVKEGSWDHIRLLEHALKFVAKAHGFDEIAIPSWYWEKCSHEPIWRISQVKNSNGEDEIRIKLPGI